MIKAFLVIETQFLQKKYLKILYCFKLFSKITFYIFTLNLKYNLAYIQSSYLRQFEILLHFDF